MSEIKFNCLHCRQPMLVDSSAVGEEVRCPTCSRVVTVPTPASPPPIAGYTVNVVKKQGMAITSLVLGILSLTCFGFVTGIPAIILGHIAQSRARKMSQQYGGKGKATAGFVMGYGSIVATLLFLPAYFHVLDREASFQCQNHMKQIGLSFRLWSTDNGDRFPFDVSSKDGGSKEWSDPGNEGYDRNPVRHFQVMSNELFTPKVLVCPSDKAKSPALTFGELEAKNVTYQLRVVKEVNESNPEVILARCPIHGHIILCDGSVLSGAAAKNYRAQHINSEASPRTEAKAVVPTEEKEVKDQATDGPITLQQGQAAGLWLPPGCAIDIGVDGTIYPHETGVIAKDKEGNLYESRQIQNHPEQKNGFFRKQGEYAVALNNRFQKVSLTDPADSNTSPTADIAESGILPLPMNEAAPARRAVQPAFQESMPESPNVTTLANRLNTWVGVGVFSRKSGAAYRYGVIQGVPAGGSVTIGIPNGKFDVYWIRQDKPSSRFRSPDSFSVTGGNSRLQKILTVTIGSAGGETPVEETF